jgi:hypothetical protein
MRTYLGRFTRDDWRTMPTDRVIFPTLNAPVLVFAEKDQPWAECIKAELNEITEYAVRRRSHLRSDKKFRGMLERARRLHLQRVELAVGFRWPQDLPGWTEFPT